MHDDHAMLITVTPALTAFGTLKLCSSRRRTSAVLLRICVRAEESSFFNNGTGTLTKMFFVSVFFMIYITFLKFDIETI